MCEAERILEAAQSILLVDWPSREVPDTLARTERTVIVKGGPGPDNFSTQELDGEAVVGRPLDHAPEHVDLVYCHRPLDELPGIVVMATKLGASVIWHQSAMAAPGERDPRGCWVPEEQSRAARALVESTGMYYIDDAYIAELAKLGDRSGEV